MTTTRCEVSSEPIRLATSSFESPNNTFSKNGA